MTHRANAATGAAVLLAAWTLIAPQVAHAVVTPADDPLVPTVSIVIDRLSPAVPEPGDTLRLSGRIISTSSVALRDVAVQLRRSSTTIPERAALDESASSELQPANGEPADVPLTGTRLEVATDLPPGARRPFSLRVPVDSLGLAAPGTYVLGLDVYGMVQGVQTLDTRQAVTRTFLPWYPPGSEIEPVSLVWLWPFADWPARGPDGVLLDDQTPRELSDGGRLDGLLDIATDYSTTVSWVADPALLQTASAMSGGYEVVAGPSVAVGDADVAAGRWLDRFVRATRGKPLRVLPYADVDATALNRGALSNDIVRAVTQGPAIAASAAGRPVQGNLYWAPFGRIDRATLNVLASAGVTSLVLSADALPSTDEALATDGLATAALPTSVGTIRAILIDPGLSSLLDAAPEAATDIVLTRQRFLAETSVVAESLPPDQSSRTLVVAPSSVRWTAVPGLVVPLLRATRTAPWLDTQSLDDLLSAPAPSASRQRGGYGPRAREDELSSDYVARIGQTSADLEAFGSVIDDPTGLVQPFSEALLRAESAAWRTEPDVGAALLADTSRALDQETDRVRVLSKGQVTLSGDTGSVPVTIANDLDRSVTVGLTLRGQPGLRLAAQPLAGIRIEPGRFASVEVDVRVVGGDPLPVEVQLLSPEGLDYGRPARITVASTAYARAAAWVVAAAFVAIAVFVVVGVTRRIRKAHAQRGGGLGR